MPVILEVARRLLPSTNAPITFALSSNENDTEPQRILQLAVDKYGVVSGTLYNQQTDKAVTIQGRVDKETQRIAFRFGESSHLPKANGIAPGRGGLAHRGRSKVNRMKTKIFGEHDEATIAQIDRPQDRIGREPCFAASLLQSRLPSRWCSPWRRLAPPSSR
jgi:hypothetical protein